MATTPNYSWVMPAPTDLVTDLPADFEIFGDAVDASLYALNPGTTAGDVDYYTSSTAKARLAIGTAGQVLQVNSGATAPEWATPVAPVSNKNWSLVNAGGTALTGAGTITVSGISDANEIMVIVESGSIDTTNQFITMRFNADTGSNYNTRGLMLEGSSAYSAGSTSSIGATTTSITLALTSSNAGAQFDSYLLMSGCNSSGLKMFNSATGVFAASSSNSHRVHSAGGFYSGTSTISSVSIITGGGNFDAGNIYVYKTA